MPANPARLPKGAGSGHRNGRADQTDRAMTPIASDADTARHFTRGLSDARKDSSCHDVRAGVWNENAVKPG